MLADGLDYTDKLDIDSWGQIGLQQAISSTTNFMIQVFYFSHLAYQPFLIVI